MRTRVNEFKYDQNDKTKQAIYSQLLEMSRWVRALKNTTTFFVRNTYTGINKTPDERTSNENKVLAQVYLGIMMDNDNRRKQKADLKAKGISYLKKAQETDSLAQIRECMHKAYDCFKKSITKRMTPYPTKKSPFLSCQQLTAIFQSLKHICYKRLYSQIAQGVVKKCSQDWDTYRKSYRKWKADPANYGSKKPRFPGYDSNDCATITLSNQTAKLKDDGKGHAVLACTRFAAPIAVGKSSFLKDAGKLIHTEIKLKHDVFKICITTDDGAQEIPVPEDFKRLLEF